MAIDLRYTPAQQAFRKEVRAWMEANVPSQPLDSFDTPAGAHQHRAWERRLHEGRWGMVTWPKEYGGRACTLVEWLAARAEPALRSIVAQAWMDAQAYALNTYMTATRLMAGGAIGAIVGWSAGSRSA